MRVAVCSINIEVSFPYQSTQNKNSHKLLCLCAEIFSPLTVLILPSISGHWGRRDMAVESISWKILPKGQNGALWITVHHTLQADKNPSTSHDKAMLSLMSSILETFRGS